MSLKENQAISSKTDTPDCVAISIFAQFLAEVEQELSNWAMQSGASIENRNKLLNGGANTAVFSLISQVTRKKYGIFFSGHDVANLAASKISEQLCKGANVIDPACGAADLLIACARHYPKQTTYAKTLNYWASRLAGIDLHEPFLKTAISRLMLLATEFHSIQADEYASIDYTSKFSFFYQSDGLKKLDTIRNYDCVVTNPPYGYIDAPVDITWASGKVQIAGLFVDKILDSAPLNQEIVAVLPDVLRSGTRYDRWRKKISERADILSLDIVGKFDKNTNVDVFIIHLKRVSNPTHGWEINIPSSSRAAKINEFFNVRVGPVVPHRDKQEGPLRLYLDCSATSGQKRVVPEKSRSIKYGGTVYRGPFVAIHRTSSPSDINRLVTCVIDTVEEVAVENHLIILQPIDGTIDSCNQLIECLKDKEVKDWLNLRIRCRHLTVAAIRDIPITWSLNDKSED